MGKVAIVEFTDYQRSVTEALDAIGAGTAISGQPKLLLKPNIINAQPPPVTTPVECVEAVLDFCRANSTAEILIGDGCGGLDTLDACEQLGYGELARRKDVPRANSWVTASWRGAKTCGWSISTGKIPFYSKTRRWSFYRNSICRNV